ARLRLQRFEMRVPLPGEMRTRFVARQREALAGPLCVAPGQKRQVEQPLAGIVDDVESQRAVRAILSLIVDGEAQPADVNPRAWPAALLDQAFQMALIGKARHAIIRLRFKAGAGDPPRGKGLEYRKTPAAGQPMDQRGDEHGLAGARQAGDAKSNGRTEQMF